ncbi:MAG: hypothetical protein AB1489_42360, partial [Acidobacteriota bacterium]
FLKSKEWQECKERLIKRHIQAPKRPRNTKDVKRPLDAGINPNINSLLGIDLNARHDDVDTDTAIQIEKDTQEFLHSKVWKEHKQKLIHQLANNTLEQHVEERNRQHTEQVVEQQQPECSEQPTVEMPAPTNVNVVAFPEEKIQALKASRLRYQTMMKIAAMVITVIAPALLTYFLLVKPAQHNDQSVAIESASINAPTRYEQLDKHLDLYLANLQVGNESEAKRAIETAAAIGEEMATKTGDMVGRDTVSYYRAIPVAAIGSLQQARRLRAEAEATISGDQYSAALQKTQASRDIFTALASNCEIERTTIQIARFLIKNARFKEAQAIIDENLQRTVDAHHLFNHAQLLNWRGSGLSATSQFNEAVEALEASIQEAQSLEVPLYTLGPSMTLAGIYYVTDNNKAAFERARKALELARPINHRYALQLLQIAGMSAFNINNSALAESYLQDAITFSEKQGNVVELIKSRTFLGIIHAEQSHIDKAQISVASAVGDLDKIKDDRARSQTSAIVLGYYARIQTLAGNVDRAIELYDQSLDLAKKANIQQNLMLSQLHQGLGESLLKKGDYSRAESELALAVALDRKANKNLEQNNALLTFAISRKSSGELLRSLGR